MTTPEEFVGNIIGDLNSRRGKVEGIGSKGAYQIVNAEVPLVNLFGYATDVRSLSQGRASFAMEFLEYAMVPAKVEQEVLNKMGR